MLSLFEKFVRLVCRHVSENFMRHYLLFQLRKSRNVVLQEKKLSFTLQLLNKLLVKLYFEVVTDFPSTVFSSQRMHRGKH